MPISIKREYFDNNERLVQSLIVTFKNNNNISKIETKHYDALANAIYDNKIIKNQSGQGGGGDDRRLYIREMCRTLIALFRELESTINRIVAPDKIK